MLELRVWVRLQGRVSGEKGEENLGEGKKKDKEGGDQENPRPLHLREEKVEHRLMSS